MSSLTKADPDTNVLRQAKAVNECAKKFMPPTHTKALLEAAAKKILYVPHVSLLLPTYSLPIPCAENSRCTVAARKECLLVVFDPFPLRLSIFLHALVV
jgi:hypothetical protein